MKIYVLQLLLLAGVAGASCATSRAERTSTRMNPSPQVRSDGPTPAAPVAHQHSGAHVRTTELRRPDAADRRRADEIVRAARGAVGKYEDYRVALGEGYEILAPDVPQGMYHFNHFGNAAEAERRFDPTRPTSLLYEKAGAGYRLIGVMYTAPAGMGEDELDGRIPLSVARWHQHVNVCLPPGAGWQEGIFAADARFGLSGSIETAEACRRAGGRFLPRLFGWMVHLYPFEKDAADAWSHERQMLAGGHHKH
ncbi:MAG TPA: hypothetical protein VIP46_11575 [Pyrinomonadaceae bacterium]